MAKTKIKERLSRTFPNCVLFRDELEELYALLAREGKQPTAECDGYSFDSLDDLCEHIGSRGALQLNLESKSPIVSFRTSSYSGSVEVGVYPSGQTETGLLSFHNVVGVLERLSLKKAWYAKGWISVTAGSAVVPFGFAAYRHADPLIRVAFIACALACAIVYAKGLMSTRKRTRFYGVLRRERESFWSRKKDDLLKDGIVAFASAGLAVCGTLLVQHLSK